MLDWCSRKVYITITIQLEHSRKNEHLKFIPFSNGDVTNQAIYSK